MHSLWWLVVLRWLVLESLWWVLVLMWWLVVEIFSDFF